MEEIDLEIAGGFKDEEIGSTIQFLKFRLFQVGLTRFRITDLFNRIKISIEEEHSFDKKRILSLLTTPGNLFFCETYPNREILSILLTAHRKLKEEDPIRKSIFDLLFPYVSKDAKVIEGPVIGIAKEENMNAIFELLALDKIKTLFPDDLTFRWTRVNYSWKGSRSLMACKETEPVQKLSIVKNAKVKYLPQSLKTEVAIHLNDGGTEIWKSFTEKNIQKDIAICIDELVYSYPQVLGKIEGGVLLVRGKFTISENDDLANILNNGPLQLNLRSTEN